MRLVEDCPICAAAGTCPSSLFKGVLYMYEHGILDVLERLFTSLCTMLNWLGSMGCPVVALWWCMGEGVLKCSLTLSPGICQTPQCRS